MTATATENQDFTTYSGDDVTPIFTVVDADGVAVDISAATQITWWCIDGGAPDTKLLTKTKTGGGISFVTTGVDGKFQVAITAADTLALPTGWLEHDASIILAAKTTTVAVGRMQVVATPVWTYNPQLISTVPLYQVRRWLGDVIDDDQQMTDAEILFAISQRSSVIGAAADCARQLAGQYSRKVDVTSPGEIRTAYGSQAKKYTELANELEQKARNRGAGVMPYAGGISVVDKWTVQSNSDRVQPNFTIGMTDNTIPMASVGPETPTVTANNGLG